MLQVLIFTSVELSLIPTSCNASSMLNPSGKPSESLQSKPSTPVGPSKLSLNNSDVKSSSRSKSSSNPNESLTRPSCEESSSSNDDAPNK